jgi:hypothetical protein
MAPMEGSLPTSRVFSEIGFFDQMGSNTGRAGDCVRDVHTASLARRVQTAALEL